MKQTSFEIDSFCFFDGETINNKYVLLSNEVTEVYDEKGLTFTDCINFLYDTAKKYNYFFGINYDINMIFQNLTEDLRTKFFNSEKISIFLQGQEYSCQYYEGKIFSLTKYKNKKSLGTKYYYDVINFFGVSFIRTLDILGIDYKEYKKELIAGKENRKDFSFEQINKIKKYNRIECILGKQIVKKIYDLLPKELKTYKLYGASSLANIFLKKFNLTKEDSFNDKIFESAYFGGRIEAVKIGTFKNCYYYDLNSAYPSIIKDLKDVLFYDDKIYKKEKIIDTNLYYITFENLNDSNVGNFPVRLKSGYLIFPKSGAGWYYGVEVKEGLKYNNIEIKKVRNITLGNKIFSDNEIENIYKKRLLLKKQNNKQQYIYKILLNSLYGKFAQKTGHAAYKNLYFAGYITASIRAKLFHLIKNCQNNLIYFATDGIMVTEKLSGIKISDELGGFSEEIVKRGFIGLAGFYYYYTDKNEFKTGVRGIKTDDIKTVFNRLEKNGKVTVESVNFITNKLADKNHIEYKNKRCTFVTEKKVIDVHNQIKRIFLNLDLKKLNDSFLISDYKDNQTNQLKLF